MWGSLTVLERRLVLLIGSVQFINILDFMMVMPLGPDFLIYLDMPTSYIGYVGGSYTLAASLAGFIGGLFFDRFDRKKALIFSMSGLVIATALGGLSYNFWFLITTRLLAGMFGGPATAIAIACIADNVASERRGQAIGLVMASFSLASVLGVPLGLQLAQWGNWRWPFFGVAILGLIVLVLIIKILKEQKSHLQSLSEASGGISQLLFILKRKTVILALILAASTMLQGFMIIPNIATFVQFNWHFPRQYLGLLYMIGGLISFLGMRFTGSLVDKYGATMITFISTLIITFVIYFMFINIGHIVPIYIIFPLFMLIMSARMVAQGTTFTKVCPPHERARFMSVASATQHIFMAFGSFLSAKILVSEPDQSLGHMSLVSWIAISIGIIIPFCMYLLERGVQFYELSKLNKEYSV
ncbi:MAG: MFS transporter [Alphaproteobacteria bacterium]|nr:MFS transporter [Alphaproteobacteria bacterium]